MRKIWPLIIVLVIAVAFSASMISADEWWNNDWKDRIPIHIKEEAGQEYYNALIEVEVDTFSLIENGLMQADCDDIRVVDSDNKLLDYEVNDCDSTKTKIKFKAHVPANFNGVLALIYHNNLDADSAETEVSAWTQKADMLTARGNLASVAYNDEIYVMGGGTKGQNRLKINELYDLMTNSWKSKSEMLMGLSSHSMAVANNRIYAAGGWKEDGTRSTNLYSYVPATDSWNTKASMSTARMALVLESVNGKLYAIGGGGDDGSPTSANEEYDPETNTWVSKADMLTARQQSASAVIDDKIYVIGGRIANNVLSNKLEIYDPDEDKWTTGKDMPTAASGCRAALLNEKIYVICDDMKAVYIYDSNENSWNTGENVPFVRAGFAVAAANNKLYFIGGITWGDQQWVYHNRLDEYSVPNTGLTVSVSISDEEVCDGFDNDADGEIDEGGVCNTIDNCGSFGNSCYGDNVANATCENGICILECEEDYYDADSDAKNGCECTITNKGVEIEDGLDNDCDGVIDFPGKDEDNDMFTIAQGDCDDTDATIYPGADEKCDGIDNNCDELIDEGCPGGGQTILEQTLATSYTIGNGECESGEDQFIAPVDCGCPEDLILVGNTCRDPSDPTHLGYVKGDNYCDKDKGETKENSPEDCKTPIGSIAAIILTIIGIAALVYYTYEHYPRKQLDSLAEESKVSPPSTSTLQDYINSCLSKGFPKHQIRDALLKRGWNESKVEDALE